MKTIQIEDDLYNELMEISKELNSQNHRATAMPYFFQIQTKEQIAVPEGNGITAWHCDGSLIETDEDIYDIISDLLEDDSMEFFNKMSESSKESALESVGYDKVNYDYQDKYQNAFFTEKACREHIRKNNYHYSEPVDYLQYATRNPEMETVLKLLCGLSGGKLHK